MKELENIAVKVDSKEQWEQVAAVLESYGFKKCAYGIFNDWDLRLQRGTGNNCVRVLINDTYCLISGSYDLQPVTFTYFMQQFGNPQPDPIAELTKRIEALEARVFGNTEQAHSEPEPKTETVYDGVFWFYEDDVSCINGNQAILYHKLLENWAVLGHVYHPLPHRLVLVQEFTVGKFYACEGGNLDTPFGYAMYLGENSFISWSDNDRYPIDMDTLYVWNIELLEVQPA
jgi:hypothetical protein